MAPFLLLETGTSFAALTAGGTAYLSSLARLANRWIVNTEWKENEQGRRIISIHIEAARSTRQGSEKKKNIFNCRVLKGLRPPVLGELFDGNNVAQ